LTQLSLSKQKTDELLPQLEALDQEVKTIYHQMVKPHWNDPPQSLVGRFNQTLYAYMMACFSHIDQLSSYWKANSGATQTKRMIDFMLKYGISSDKEACNVAVQIWRHKLMHTAEPRTLVEKKTGKVYWWLLHWSDNELPRAQHFMLTEANNRGILSIALTCLLDDIKKTFTTYLADLSVDPSLQANFQKVDNELQRDQEFTMV
jgi:hypothetical protein